MAGKAPSEPIEALDAVGLSDTMRKYLAEIYRLADHGETDAHTLPEPAGQALLGHPFVSTSALADLLNVSAPAVNRMISKLRETGLLLHEPYQGIRLTPAGEREALKQLRRQRIVEAFLVTVMHFGWHEVNDEAARMSANLTERLIERMARMAGNPTTCPHGEPIADADGVIVAPDDILLTHAPHKLLLTITRVRTRERDRLEYLAALGLTPHSTVEVLHAAPFNGPLQLRVGKEYRIVGHNLAEMIRVARESG
ncbi:MAG: metal-dependent transcriptional regulator [Chloroflexota bacterium]|nr:metal-dependent transcriptional regulator [Chloroflexota bacterium]